LRSTPQPEQHHRINQSPLSLESGLGTENLAAELNKKVIHQNRALLSPIQKAQQMKAKINFPSSNSKLWDKVNTELETLYQLTSLTACLKNYQPQKYLKDWMIGFTNFFFKVWRIEKK